MQQHKKDHIPSKNRTKESIGTGIAIGIRIGYQSKYSCNRHLIAFLFLYSIIKTSKWSFNVGSDL